MIENNQFIAQDCSEVTLVLYAATSYNGLHKSPSKEGKNPHQEINNYRKISEKHSYKKLKEEHITDYQSLFKRVSFNLHTNKQLKYTYRPTTKTLQEKRGSNTYHTTISVRTIFDDSRFTW